MENLNKKAELIILKIQEMSFLSLGILIVVCSLYCSISFAMCNSALIEILLPLLFLIPAFLCFVVVYWTRKDIKNLKKQSQKY